MHDIIKNKLKPFFHEDEGCACGCGEHHHEHTHEEHHHHEHGESCSCGHHHEHKLEEHHHHEHGEACSCGHHHEHSHEHAHEEHHHHEHGETCSCGHHLEHTHEEHHHHEHGETCSCGHHHEHVHEEHHHHEHGESCSCGHHHEHRPEHAHEEHHHPHHEHRDDSRTPKTIFLLENLGCAHCAAKMEDKINELPDVTYATITYATKQLRISTTADPQKLLPEIQKICASIESQVKVVPNTPAPRTIAGNSFGNTTGTADDTRTNVDSKNDTSAKKSFFKENQELIEIAGGAVLFIAGIAAAKLNISDTASLIFFVLSYLLLGSEVLLEAARNIKNGQVFDENFLMGIATIGAFAIREYPEAVGVMLFYRIGEFFEEKAVEKSRGQIMEAIDLRPEVVNLIHGSEIQTIPAEQAQVGDLLLIRPGDRIPLDGVIVEGESRIDTSPITGEPVPVAVRCGDKITSGCVNTSGQLKMRAEKPLSESMVTRILDSVENAAASKPKIDRFITRFSRVYTPCVVFGALAVAVIPSIITGNWNYWVYTALTFLVMSCPCALVLSVPLAFFSGIGAGSKRGILFKGGLSIEALSQVKSIVMDKTGTITKGNFELQKIVPAGKWSEDELLRICAGCEQNSTHPIAHSIVSAALKRGLTLDTPSSLEEIAGHGITAHLPQGHVLCGNRKLMNKYQISVKDSSEKLHGAEVYIAIDGIFAGHLLISDTVKPDAKDAVARLNSMGLHTVMLTGDSENSANAVAHETGIKEVHAKLLPQDKLDLLKKVRAEHGAVMFVGDGINDAPVLAGADVGAAMGSGADAAIEAADAVFMQSAVSSIPDSIAIARATNNIAIQNVVFALAIKLGVMVLGLLGFANMWMAVFADSGVAMLCVLNSIRVLYKKTVL